MSDIIALACTGIGLIMLLVWLVTYWHGLRENARALAEVRRLNADWFASVAEWHEAVAEWQALCDKERGND